MTVALGIRLDQWNKTHMTLDRQHEFPGLFSFGVEETFSLTKGGLGGVLDSGLEIYGRGTSYLR